MPQKQSALPRLAQAMIDAFKLPDLRMRLLFTLGILVLFRFLAHIPVPGVDVEALANAFSGSTALSMLNLFGGGAMEKLSIIAMTVYPYITASIVMQLLVPVIPRLQALAKEGEAGRDKINLYTHWLTVPLAAIQGYGVMLLLRNQYGILPFQGALQDVTIVLTLVAGTMLLVWLGELITERGLGNGISLIICAGIVVTVPGAMWQTYEGGGSGLVGSGELFKLIIFSLAIVVLIVFVTEAYRRIPVHYSKSVIRGRRMYRQTGSSYIPLKVNMAGMIPLIFAMSLMIFPGTIASYFANPQGMDPNFANTIMNWFNPGAALPVGLFYWGFYFLMVVAFAFFYTVVIFEQMDLARTLQRQGGFIPGVRPGKPTTDYLNKVISHITWGGALFLALVAVMPFFARTITNVSVLTLSSMGMLIIVGVALDTMKQIEAQLTMRRYEGFLK